MPDGLPGGSDKDRLPFRDDLRKGVLPHSSVGILGDLIGMLEKIL
jgi:hypothetical protein